jgi:predicted HTH transcriptional regulator
MCYIWRIQLGNSIFTTFGDFTFEVADKTNKTQHKILNEIKGNSKITIEELTKMLNMSDYGVRKNIKFLKESRYIERVGSNKNGYWFLKDGK